MNETRKETSHESTATHSQSTIPSSTGAKAAEIKNSPEDKKLVFRLAEHIDENGRYNDALKPMALGFASGKKVSEFDARKEIDTKFEQEMGVDLKGYLENHRLERGLTVDSGRSR